MKSVILLLVAFAAGTLMCLAWATVMKVIGAPLILSFVGGFAIGYITVTLVFVIADELGFDIF